MRTPASCCQVRQRACAAHRRRARSRVVSLFGGREVVVPVADDLVCMLDDCREANDVEEEVDGERCALAVLDVIVLARRIHPLRAPPAPKESEHESARSGRAAAGQRQGSGRAAAEQRPTLSHPPSCARVLCLRRTKARVHGTCWYAGFGAARAAPAQTRSGPTASACRRGSA